MLGPSTPRSIALISSNAPSLANFRAPLIRALVSAGVKVWALAPDYDDQLRAIMRDCGAEPVDISLDRTGMRPRVDLRDMLALAAVLRRLRPDATLAYFIKPVIYGAIAARLAGIGRRFSLVAGMGYVFTRGEDDDTLKRKSLRAVVQRLYGLAFRLSERVFFHNGDDLGEMVRLGMLDRSKAVLIAGTGIEIDRFEPTPPPVEPFRCVLVARLLREKGIVEYVEAARIVKGTRPDIEFHLVGGTDTNPGAISEAEVRGWVEAGLITWHGQVADVRPYVASASLFVLPSYREGKPRSTQEALAMGRPVVTTDAVGCRDTVEDGVNGWRVPVADAPALAAAILRMAESPDALLRMGAASRTMAEQVFDVRLINRSILANLGIQGGDAALRSAAARSNEAL